MKILGLEEGRFNRSTFILTSIVSLFVTMILFGLLCGVLGTFGFSGLDDTSSSPLFFLIALLWWVYHSFCVIRRLHDLGMSGWWLIGYFVPFVNFILGLWLLFEAGKEDANKYGKHPKTISIIGLVVWRKTHVSSKPATKWDGMKAEILKPIGLAIIVILVILTGLHGIKGSVSPESLSDNSSAVSYMEKNFDEYDKCRYSVENGSTRVEWITMSYRIGEFKLSHYDYKTTYSEITDEEEQRLEDTTNKFMDGVRSKCNPIISKYEEAKATQEKTSKEIAMSQLSLYDKWILRKNADNIAPQELQEPVELRYPQDESNYVFTTDEVQQFFRDSLGY